MVAIHNKNGQGLLHKTIASATEEVAESQSTIKMDKGYYKNCSITHTVASNKVAIHNKNGQGLLH